MSVAKNRFPVVCGLPTRYVPKGPKPPHLFYAAEFLSGALYKIWTISDEAARDDLVNSDPETFVALGEEHCRKLVRLRQKFGRSRTIVKADIFPL